MRRLWATARQTAIECLRTKAAVVFALLLAGGLVGTGAGVEGDGTLRGRIQTFLAYSTTLTQVLLGLVAVLLAVRVVSEDVRAKTIFTVATKPLARWQYIAGRWLGVMLIAVAALGLSTAAIYGFAQHLRGLPTEVEAEVALGRLPKGTTDLDRTALENELFKARAAHHPQLPDVDDQVNAEYRELVEEKGEDNVVREHIRLQLDQESGAPREKAAREAEIARRASDFELRKQIVASIRQGIRTRLKDQQQLVRPGEALRLEFQGLSRPVEAGQTVQLRYRLHAMKRPGSGTLISRWVFRTSQAEGELLHTDSVDAASSVMLLSRAIGEDGLLTLIYQNYTPGDVAVKLKPEDVTLYYPVATFEGNLLRSTLVVALRLAFLAAAGVLLGSFLSFPVAAFSGMALLLFGIMGDFILEATKLSPYQPGGAGAFDHFSHWLARGLFAVVPRAPLMGWPSDALAHGVNVGWQRLGRELAIGTGLRAAAGLLVAWLLFFRKELARVQV